MTAAALELVHRWNQRERRFSSSQVALAWLARKGWIGETGPATAE
jgi:hypothetical protein